MLNYLALYYRYMTKQQIAGGTVHPLPEDVEKVLRANPKALELWEKITPLARNEWICLVTDAKKPETRIRRLERTRSQLTRGQRRPCCWAGCPHRSDKDLSPTQQWIADKKPKD